ncbi:MAG: methylmalonyl-CoA epimerase [Acidobacteria bacterium]|nr:methylmalonyl-CoA epimerase [Acidobacteriota bacterium]
MYRKIDHIGIAVRDLDAALAAYQARLGIPLAHIEEVPEQKTRVALLPVGESRIELLEATEPESPVGRFLAKRGEGIHHICFQVEDLAAELQVLKSRGVRLIDETPRRGAHGCLVAFVHPSSAHGVLIELSQPAQ